MEPNAGKNNHYSNGNGHNANGNGIAGYAKQKELQDEDQNDPFDPNEILFALWEGKWIILTCILLIGAAGYFYTQTLPNQYRTSAIFLIESQRADRGLNLFEFTRSRSLTWNEIGTEMEYIKNSTELGEEVGRRLLNQQFNPATGDTLPILLRAGFGQLPEDRVVSRLGRMMPATISLNQIDEMNLVEMQSQSTDPYEAALVVNYYIEQYGQIDEEITRKNLNAAADYLEELEEESSETLTVQDRRLRDFLKQDWSLVTDEQGNQTATELRNLYQEYEEMQFRYRQTEDYLSRLRDERDEVLNMIAEGVGTGVEAYLTAVDEFILDLELQAEEYYIEQPELRDNPEQNVELSNIMRRIEYLEESRREKLQQQRANIQELQGLDAASLTTYLTDIRTEIRQNEASLVDLEARIQFVDENIEDRQQEMLQVMESSAELSRMRRNMRINEELYVNLLRRLQETQVAIRSEVSRVREIRPAFVPGVPFSPNRTRNYLLSIILGAALGGGLVLLRKFLDDMIHDPDQLRKASFNVIGLIPDLTEYAKTHFKGQKRVPVMGKNVDVNLVTIIDPLAAGSEAYRRLKSNIEFSRADKKTQTIVIASSKPSEGKSLTAINLALTYAQYGEKVLLVDTDMRKPTVHKLLDLKRSPGLADIIFDKSDIQSSINESTIENFHVLTCGTAIPNPAEAMGSDKMKKIADELRDQFDIIIFDTPPLQIVSDALPLAVEHDATILVCRAEETELDILKNTRRDMREIGVELVGTVLNGFDYTKGISYYKYNYKYKYNYAYKNYRINFEEMDKS